MAAFLDVTLTFPVVLFTFMLVVVVGYWLVVLLGAADLDVIDAPELLGGLGLAGVPVTVALSLLVVLGWFATLVGTVLVDGAAGAAAAVLSVAVLAAGLLLAWLSTGLLVRPLRRVFAAAAPPSRSDFLGRVCVIRTGQVTADFGQAEVTADDGSSAIIQVRQPGPDPAGAEPLRAGSTALIFDYDPAGEFFWVTTTL
jgi:hypothetical protein